MSPTPEQPPTADPRAGRQADPPPRFSVVIPFYNEQECAPGLLAEVLEVMDRLGSSYEILAVDDGSRDDTPRLLAAFAAEHPVCRPLTLSPNRGQAAALYHGMHQARGDLIITMDGDGQNDPADIPRLLPLLAEADMVVGIRARRSDSWLRRAMSRVANGVRARLLRDHMRDSGCALKVFRHEVVDAFIPMLTLYSFMPALAVAGGYRLAQIEVNHRARQGGDSSYGLLVMLWRPLLDLLGVWWFSRRRFIPPPSEDG